jgi:hypothetical protein
MNRRRKTPLVSDELTAATDAAGSWTRLLFQRADPKLALRAAQAMAQTIDRTLGVAGALAQTGRTVDLTGLEELIGRLTAAAIDLDDDDRRQIQPTLNGLLHSVARLENALHPPRGTG